MRDLRLPVEVDPVSDARWTRIEREMFAKLDATDGPGQPVPEHAPVTARRGRVFALSCAAAVAAAAALVIAHPWKGSRSGERMRLATTDSASQFTVGESSLVVAPRSLVMVDGDDDHGIDVVLDRGAVTCEVAPRNGRPPFVVDSGDVRVRVVGTRFTVARDAEGTSVEVDHGVVEVTARGLVTTLHDGDRWPERPRPSTSLVPGVAPAGAETVPTAAGQAVAVQAPSPAHAPTAPRTRGAPPMAAPSTGSDTVPSRSALEESTPANAVASNPPAPSAAVTTSTPPIVAGPSPQKAFESASRIERARPDEAAAAYRQLAAGGTEWAPNALFALARLEAEHGRKAEAVRLLNEYLTRYPRGVNAEDARSLLLRMQ